MPCLRILSHSANREKTEAGESVFVKINCNEFPLFPRPPVYLRPVVSVSVSGYLYSGPGVCLAGAHYYPAHDQGVSLPRSDQSV